MGYYTEIVTRKILDVGCRIQLPLGKKNSLAVTEALQKAGIDAKLYYEHSPRLVG